MTSTSRPDRQVEIKELARQLHEVIQTGPASFPRRAYEDLPEGVRACGLRQAEWILAKIDAVRAPLAAALRDVRDVAKVHTTPGAPETDAGTLRERLAEIESRAETALREAHASTLAADARDVLLALTTRLQLQEENGRLGITSVEVLRQKQPNGGMRWSVLVGGSDCLAKDGTLEMPPLPSGRDDAFFARCRYDTLQEAIAAARAFIERPSKIEFVETLVYYDAPIAVLARVDDSACVFFGLNGGSEDKSDEDIWLFAPLTKERLKGLREGTLALRDAVLGTGYVVMAHMDTRKGAFVRTTRVYPDEVPDVLLPEPDLTWWGPVVDKTA